MGCSFLNKADFDNIFIAHPKLKDKSNQPIANKKVVYILDRLPR